jgi:mRNA interferase MazF
MRPIHLAMLDKTRPVLILTREQVRPYLTSITVAPITSTIRGLSTEVPIGKANGLDHNSVISCDNITTIPSNAIGRLIGYLHSAQEPMLANAIAAAYDLDIQQTPGQRQVH